MKTIDLKLVSMGLARVEGASFELFVQGFMAALTGHSFVPLGGSQDGGADGLFEFQGGGKPNRFLQVTTQADHRAKIRQTAGRLREVGRQPEQIVYCTSQTVSKLDLEEDLLTRELEVDIRIRDQRYIETHINESLQTIQAFNSYISPALSFLQEFGGSSMIGASPQLPARALCVFLGQEVDRRRGNTQLLVAVTDSLVLWSLEGTDPAKGVFMTREEILARIEAALPSARHFVRGKLDERLEQLSKKSSTIGREIRSHKKGKAFCLPHETRQIVFRENAEDEALKDSVSAGFKKQAEKNLAAGDANLVPLVVNVCHRTLEITFEKQGLEIAAFVSSKEPDSKIQSSISDNMDRALDELNAGANQRAVAKAAAMPIIRRAFYDSTEVERTYLSKLSRTYTLLFVLKNEPRVVEFFQNMSSKFVLYVGSDLIVRAISERYLKPEDRMTWNMFKILAAAGAELVLTEITLTEVRGNIRKADREFVNDFASFEPSVDLDLARHIDQILMRAYFYARLNPDQAAERPRGWQTFVGQFCTYSDLHGAHAKDSLRRSLCEEFGFTFEADDEMRKGVDKDELRELADKVAKARKRRDSGKDDRAEARLAENDALHVLRIFAKRRALRETQRSNPYGFRTWWLTQETTIRLATPELVAKYGSPYMRPEFLLNFIALAPSLAQVRQSFEAIFPSLLGVKLSNRMREDVFQIVVGKVKEANSLSEGRARALVAELSDKLKGDHFKIYENELTSSRGAGGRYARRSS